MENHGHVHPVLAPGPRFRDVIFILEANHQVMLMARIRRRQITSAVKIESQLLHFLRDGHGAHARLIVRRTKVDQRESRRRPGYTPSPCPPCPKATAFPSWRCSKRWI